MIRNIILISAILMFAIIANATVWRVNNRANMDADFSTLQTAIDGATSGDTLYIGGSPTNYGDGIFNKQLVVIGAGYWLEENDTTQACKENSQVRKLTFDAGSEGTVIQGLYIYYSSNSSFKVITINTNNITLEKNHIYAGKGYNGSATSYGIFIPGSRSNIIITQNWIIAVVNSSHTTDAVYGIYFVGVPTNCKVSNNFIRAYQGGSSGQYSAINVSNNFSNNLMIVNNVIWGPINTYYTEHVNNILVTGSYNNGIGNETFNNICNGTQFPDNNNNLQNVDMSTIFMDYEKYIDNGYILAPGSPAIGAGITGGDCGVYSYDWGGIPYVLSGMPEIPAIFEVTVPTTGSVSLPVNIKATSHNANK